MTVKSPGRGPANDGELIRDIHDRLRIVENSKTMRVGPWVLQDRDGSLVATRPGDASVIGGDGAAEPTEVDLGALADYVSQKDLADVLKTLPTGQPGAPPTVENQILSAFNDLYNQLSGFLNPTNAINALAGFLRLEFLAPIASFRLPFLPVSSLGDMSPELLPNPGFDGANSIESNDPKITWDGTTGHTSHGCAKFIADGQPHALIGGVTPTLRIPVSVNQNVPVSVWVRYDDIVATALSTPIQIKISAYNSGALVSSTTVAGIASPDGDSLGKPGADVNGWIPLSYTYVVPSGVDAIFTELHVTADATAGIVRFDDGSTKKSGLMPMGLVEGLVAAWTGVYEAFTGMVGAGIQEVSNAWRNLMTMLQVPDLATLIGNPLTFNPNTFIQQFISEGLNPQNMLAQLNETGRLLAEQAPLALQQILNGVPGLVQGVEVANQTADNFIDAFEAGLNAIQQGITGTEQTIAQGVQAGIGGAQAQVNNAVAGVRQQLTGLQQQIATLFGLVPQSAVAAIPAGIDDIARESTVSSNDWGPDWTIIAATGTTHADGTSIVWDKTGAAARFVIGRYDIPTAVTPPATTSYQKARFIMSKLMENPASGGSPDAGNMLIAHALQDFTEFMFMRIKYNKLQLGYYQGTADVAGYTNAANWHVFEEMTPSGKWPLADWEFICGDITSARKYIGLSLGARQLSDTNSDFTLTDDHIYSGMGFFSADQGAFESAPGSISLFQLDNYSPVAYPGSGMSVYRTLTAAVTPNMPAFKLPSGFFDQIEYCSPDIIWDGEKVTVLSSGHYGVELSIRLSSEQQNIGMGTQIAKNGEISGKVCNVNRGPNQIAVYGHFTIALMAGDYFQPIFYNLSSVNITGESTGNFTYMTVAKLNP